MSNRQQNRKKDMPFFPLQTDKCGCQQCYHTLEKERGRQRERIKRERERETGGISFKIIMNL